MILNLELVAPQIRDSGESLLVVVVASAVISKACGQLWQRAQGSGAVVSGTSVLTVLVLTLTVVLALRFSCSWLLLQPGPAFFPATV